jgi:hypothetical protein
MATRRGDWTPDEIVLTIWAHHEIQAQRNRQGAILADLVAELGREPKAVEAAVAAVAGGPGDSLMLKILVGRAPRGKNLLSDPAWARREARKIRRHWKRP